MGHEADDNYNITTRTKHRQPRTGKTKLPHILSKEVLKTICGMFDYTLTWLLLPCVSGEPPQIRGSSRESASSISGKKVLFPHNKNGFMVLVKEAICLLTRHKKT